jgi:hypothetical protein
MKATRFIKGWFKSSNLNDSDTLIAPAYDSITQRTSAWAKRWRFKDVEVYTGSGASHRQALAIARRHNSGRRLFFFIGHGSPAGLLTNPKNGKTGSPVSNNYHGCLLDTDDLQGLPPGLQVVAWACDAGMYFGPGVSKIRGGSFLGFRGKVDLVFNDKVSEDLWSSAIETMFDRVLKKGRITSQDEAWVRNSLLGLQRKIHSGEIDTKKYNRINSMFLRKAAARVVVR